MIKPFDAPTIKIDRAKQHLQELRFGVVGFFQRGGAQVIFEDAPEYSKGVGFEMAAFTYREREPIPTLWGAIIGDVVHNLRASLDLVVSDVHRLTGCNPKDIYNVHYPFCKEQAALREMIKSRRLNHIGRDFIEIIEETKPYKGGNDGLRAIHDLDLTDKHQMLVPTVSVAKLDWPVEIKEGPKKFVTGVTHDGQRLVIFPRSYAKLPIGCRINAEFSIVFDGVGTFNGCDVINQLDACVSSIEFIIDLFRTAAEKRGLIPIRSA